MKRLLIIFLCLWPVWAWADSEGPNYPTAYQLSDNWVNPDSIYAVDNKFATYSSTSHQDRLSCDNYGFSVIGTIDSIYVRVYGWGDAKGEEYRDLRVGLCKDARIDSITGDNQHFIMPEGENGYDDYMFPGTGFTASEVNAQHFGPILWPDIEIDGNTFYIDNIRITVYSHISPSQSLAFYDSSSTSLSVYDNYNDDYEPDTLFFVINDDSSTEFHIEIDTIASPTDPDSTVFTGLSPGSRYYAWGITSVGGVRDTSSSINRYTKHVKFMSHAVTDTNYNSVKIEGVLADTTGAVDYLYLKFGTSSPPAYKDTITAGDARDTFEVLALSDSTKYYYQLVVKDENYRDSTGIDSIYTRSTPTTAPDSLMVTTFYSEHWDPDGYGYSNPDPDSATQGLVTYKAYFSARTGGSHEDVYLYDLKVMYGDSTVWNSGWVNLGDTIAGGIRSPKIQYPDSSGRRFHPGYEYKAEMRFKSDAVTSDWTDLITFTGVMPYESALPKWKDNSTIWFGPNHDAISNWVPITITAQTGEGQLITDNSLRDGAPNIYRNPADSFIYLANLEKSSKYPYDYGVGGYQGDIRKIYDADTSDWGTGYNFGMLYKDAHSIPMLTANSTSLHTFISGHNLIAARYFRCDSSIAGQGFCVDQTIGGAGTATGGTSTTLIDTTKTTHWKTNQLKNWWICIRPNDTYGDVEAEEKEIVSNNGETLTVASAWSDNPANGDEYYIYYTPDAFDGMTYPFPVTMPNDSVYIFYRVDMDVTGGDSSGTATGGSSNTLINSGKSYTTNAFTGWHIINTTLNPDEEQTIASNTATTFTITGTWDTNPVNGNAYVLETPHKGFLCYSVLDPYADSINVAFSDPYIVMNYNDAPAWIQTNYEPVIYASAFHNDYYDNDEVYVEAVFWDQYGSGLLSDDQGGSGITAIKSTLDDGLFRTWTNVEGDDTIGYAFQNKFYHGSDSTINRAAIVAAGEMIDTCYGVDDHDSLFIGAGNQSNIVVDTLGNVYVVYAKFYDDNYAQCSMHLAINRANSSIWEKYNITGTADSLINFRFGPSISLQGDIMKIYAGVFADTTAEVMFWKFNVNDVTPNISSGFLTKNSGSGMGRMATLQYVPEGNNRRISYSRNFQIYEMIDRDWIYWGSDYPIMRTDGEDAWIVLRKVDSLTTITNTFLNRRTPTTFQAKETPIEFTTFLTLAEDSTRFNTDGYGNDYILQYYNGNRNCDSSYSQRVNSVQGIYKYLESFESYAHGYDLDDASTWIVTTDSVRVYNYLEGRWTHGIQDGMKYACLFQGATAKLASVPTLSSYWEFGCYLYSGSYDGSRGFLCFYSDNGVKKFGIGKYSATSLGYLYNFDDSLAISDTICYVEGPVNIEFRLGDILPNGAYSVYARSEGVTLVSSDVNDTMETGTVTTAVAGGDKIIDVNGNWVADSRNGMYVKVTSGTYADSVREISDTKIDTLILASTVGGAISVGNTYTIWDTTVGVILPLDSVTVECDTGSVYMDFVYRQKDYEKSDTLETILSVQGEYPQARGSITIGGD